MLAAFSFATAMLVLAAIGYRSLAWSLDTPVLRRAVRYGRATRSSLYSLALGLASATWAVYRLGEQQMTPASLLFGGMFLLFGGAAGLFCSLLVEDVRDVFLHCIARMNAQLRLRIAGLEEPHCDVQAVRRCASEHHCTAEQQPCQRSKPSTPAWRPADWQRSRQPR